MESAVCPILFMILSVAASVTRAVMAREQGPTPSWDDMLTAVKQKMFALVVFNLGILLPVLEMRGSFNESAKASAVIVMFGIACAVVDREPSAVVGRWLNREPVRI